MASGEAPRGSLCGQTWSHRTERSGPKCVLGGAHHIVHACSPCAFGVAKEALTVFNGVPGRRNGPLGAPRPRGHHALRPKTLQRRLDTRIARPIGAWPPLASLACRPLRAARETPDAVDTQSAARTPKKLCAEIVNEHTSMYTKQAALMGLFCIEGIYLRCSNHRMWSAGEGRGAVP